jgi:glucose/mannose transport system substrate-binding protein
MYLNRKPLLVFLVLALLGLILAGCTVQQAPPAAAPQEVVKTVVVEKEVVKEVEKVVTATPEAVASKLEIFHWWTAGGEREAADAMFEALHAKHADVEVVENPVAGGGGVSHRVVLQARLSAGLPPDTFQTLGGAELKSYVDGGYLEPLDELWTELNYREVIPGPLANAVTIDGHPYVVPLNMHIQNILYFNKPLFDELGLSRPRTSMN